MKGRTISGGPNQEKKERVGVELGPECGVFELWGECKALWSQFLVY